MIVRTAIRELGAHPARTLLGVAGVAVAGAMLLDMLMLSSGMQRSFSGLLTGAGYEIRVSPAGTLPLDTEATIPDADGLLDRLRREPGVARVAPVLAANLARSGRDDGVFALGVDPADQGVYRLRSGTPPGPGEVVVGDVPGFAGVEAGDTIRLGAYGALGSVVGGAPRAFVVSGRAEFVYVSDSEDPVALDLGTLRQLTGQADQVSFVMVGAVDAAEGTRLTDRLAATFSDVRILSVEELVAQAERRLSYFRQLALILGSVSLIVAALLIGTIAAVSINDRYAIIAAARAIGISRRSVLATLLLESVLQALLAAGLGIALGLATSRVLEGILSDFPGLPEAVRFFVADGPVVLLTLAAIVGVAVVAALGPAYRASRLPIATTLHREEP